MGAKEVPKKRRAGSGDSSSQQQQQSPTEESLKIRREKNREAQQVFRKRRQAAQAAQTRRTQRLEAVVEEMSCIFIGFFDEMVQTAGVADQHPALIKSLRRSLVRVVALANDVGGLDGSDPAALEAAVGVQEEQHHQQQLEMEDVQSVAQDEIDKTDDAMLRTESARPIAAWDAWSQQHSSHPQLHQHPLPTFVDLAEIDITAFDLSPRSASASLPDPPPSLILDSSSTGCSADPATSTASPSLTAALNVYGNGWTPLNLPPSVFEEAPYLPSRPLQNQLSSLDAFCLRLIERSVANGYHMLHDNPGAIEHPSFRLSRLFRTPEQLATSFRWLLGPGRQFMHRASGVNWGKDGGTVAALPGNLVDARMSAGCEVSECSNRDLIDVPDCLTAVGIQAELESLGAKMIDSETMEVRLGQSLLSSGGFVSDDQSSTDIGMDNSDNTSVLGTWTYFDFFSTHRPEPPSQTLRMDVSALIKNLSAVAICFARGPGYPRQQLLSIMRASTCVS